MPSILEPERQLPVRYDVDVIVVGGGPGGIGAALGAARNGAKTLLVERFGCLGGSQTLTYSSSFSFVNSELHGGFVKEITERMDKGGGVVHDIPEKWDRGGWGPKQGVVFFDGEYYKQFLDNVVLEAGVKVLFHTFAVGAIREGNSLKALIVETREGRFAIRAKVIIDCSGIGDIAWKSGAPVIGEEGFPDGPYKGQHMGYGWAYFIGGLDVKKYRAFEQEHPEEWNQYISGRKLIADAKAKGNLYLLRNSVILGERENGRVWVLSPGYTLQPGQHPWEVEAMTAGEIDLRKQAWSLHKLLKENVPGFENSYIEQTPVQPLLRDGHRLRGEHILTEEDMTTVKTFDDGITVCNMPPDYFLPNGTHHFAFNVTPYDIPYRCLISTEIDNLLAAGASVSLDFKAWAAVRYNTPSMCTGQAAGTAAALCVQQNVTPKRLHVPTLQETLRAQGLRTTVKEVTDRIIKQYEWIPQEALPIEDYAH